MSIWQDFNLVEGEMNLFFEGAFMGKSVLDLQKANDTLLISLGRDKNVSLNRKKLKDFNQRQFLGGSQTDIRTWGNFCKKQQTAKHHDHHRGSISAFYPKKHRSRKIRLQRWRCGGKYAKNSLEIYTSCQTRKKIGFQIFGQISKKSDCIFGLKIKCLGL